MATRLGFLKYGLFTLNIIFVIYHIILTIIGLYITYKIAYIKGNISGEVYAYIIIVLATSVTFIIGALLGYCATIRESVVCAIMYSIFLLLIYGTQGIFLVYAAQMNNKMFDFGYGFVAKIWHNHRTEQQVMDRLQITFRCCGRNGYQDYGSIPNSCCNEDASYCTNDYAWNGCKEVFLSTLIYAIDSIVNATFGIAAVELIALVFSCCLADQILKKKKEIIQPL